MTHNSFGIWLQLLFWTGRVCFIFCEPGSVQADSNRNSSPHSPGHRFEQSDYLRKIQNNVSDTLLLNSVQNWGNETRLQDVLGRAKAGLEINVLVLGSSIALTAGCTLPLPPLQRTCNDCCGARKFHSLDTRVASASGWAKKGVMAAFSEFVSTAKINIFNAAQPMGGPVQFLSCINAWVPQPETIDLFIMEFAVTSETHLSSAKPDNMEVLIRWALSLPRRPAMIFANFLEWCESSDESIRAEYKACRWGDPSRFAASFRSASCRMTYL
ncbi:hypothetical protein CYMTET_42413 [Cymbomonas tetramitiformis]|uniref:Uncharacterized protein n=1 Tax=Cymbomonas tetramitiformis TaxID=36881 RepID=A0AAE0F2N3_9CHLO|nr:hypothetical protein CYMTET_42413 [Cymbomonas tetramitiformis]